MIFCGSTLGLRVAEKCGTSFIQTGASVVVGCYKVVVSRLITRYWPVVIAGWIALALVLRGLAPAWEDVAADGDLAFLPHSVPSAIGQRKLVESFPAMRARSQMLMIFANVEEPLTSGDMALAMDVTRRLHWIAAKNAWRGRHPSTAESNVQPTNVQPTNGTQDFQPGKRKQVDIELIIDNLTQAIEIEEVLGPFLQTALPDSVFQRLPDAYQMRGEVLKARADPSEQAAATIDLDTAALMREQQTPVLSAELPVWGEYIQDVWSWRHPIMGHKLGSAEPQARLINIQLGSDFTAISNIDALGSLEQLVQSLRPQYASLTSEGLAVEVSGSAAVGADMLRAAASGVRQTELVTIVLVLLILILVYRAPFLVAIPLTSIALSLTVATSIVALLARDPHAPLGESYGLGVFTTTRIFIVVLLFGAGTDFCLFLLARSREKLESRPPGSRQQWFRTVASSWRSVHDALVASALTTVVGLALMWFSRFEKFQFSGPIIAISLLVTLCVCLTFTPALLSGLGRVAFWPRLKLNHQSGSSGRLAPLPRLGNSRTQRYWAGLAAWVVRQPLLATGLTLGALGIPAAYGLWKMEAVTYDLTEELSASAPSRRGARLISQFFPTQDGSPITVLLTLPEPFESEEGLRVACAELSKELYTPGVDAVRSLTDPLGDYPPGKRMGLFDKDAWRRRLLNRLAQERYVSSVEHLQWRVARFDIVLDNNPFSLAASATLARINEVLQQLVSQPDSAWKDATFATAGTTVGITDLRFITQGDRTRIQILVTLGVWLVLVVLLRQWVLSSYLIFTVLLSYFATLGITYAVFALVYGPSYSGLDWKVPIFLFVILVAVGQDYNVYLVTRIFEERGQGAGTKRSVQRAVEATGGIITSCGFVMAGTFIAMTSPAVFVWLSPFLPAGWVDPEIPVLRGITELGFALACGVLLDTLVVRSILVPAFVVLWQSRQDAAQYLPEPSQPPPGCSTTLGG
jgi:RND superfamily putative drug exporter